MPLHQLTLTPRPPPVCARTASSPYPAPSGLLPWPDHPELGFDPPAGTEPVLAAAGDALVFDRRLWHSRSDNLSEYTRRVVFLAYTFRWVRPRGEFGIDPANERFRRLSPVRRQLLGEPTHPHHQRGLQPGAVPLRAELGRPGVR